MPSKICPNCGHKNKASESICTKCGNFLDETTQPVAQTVEQPEPMAPEPQKEEEAAAGVRKPDETSSGSVPVGSTYTIKSGGDFLRYLPILISAIILAIYILLDLYVIQSIYLFFVFLLLIFLVPGMVRNRSSPVKFFTGGFRIPSNGTSEDFYFRDIDSAEVVNPSPGTQMVTLSMGHGEKRVTLDFDRVYPLRLFLTQLNRRRIPINVKRNETSESA